MVRKLALAVSLALGATSFNALSMGLGNIQARSALNERFKADIELLSVKKGVIRSVKVELASLETFENAGIDRTFLLSKLKFSTVTLPNGRSMIQISSHEPIREPYLNFLIEVNWPEGRMIREYTVLLDPPASMLKAPDGTQLTGISGPIIGMTEAIVMPMSSTMGYGVTSPPVGGYGPIRPNETLWGIAKQFRYAGAEMGQMVMAILRANPHAFKDGNVNNMAKGVILNIPNIENVMAIDAYQAQSEFRDQLVLWESMSTVVSGQVERSTQDKVTTPESKGSAAGMPAGSSSGVQSTKDRGNIKRLEKELSAAQMVAEKTRKESDDLLIRLDELETKLKEMQQLLFLKDEQIADLQAQQKQVADTAATATKSAGSAAGQSTGGGKQAAMMPDKPKPAPKPEPVVQPVVAKVEPEPDPEPESMAQAKPAAPEMPSAKPATPVMPADQKSVESTDVAMAEPAIKPESKPEPAVQTTPEAKPETVAQAKPEAKPQPVAQAKPEPKEDMMSSIIDMVMGNILYIGGGLGGLLAIGGGVWFIRRRKKDGEGGSSEPESILMSDAPHGESEMATEENPLSGLTTEETSFLDSLSSTGNFSDDGELDDGDETSFLSDFVPSDIEALQEETGEVDPLAEADVYIAYGRYKQAEELIRQALERDPNKSEYRFKLFEVLHAAKDKTAFSQLLAECAAMGFEESNPDAWNHVLEMDNELESASTDETPTSALEEEEKEKDADDLGLGLDVGSLSDISDLSDPAELDDDMDLDFSDLGLGGEAEQDDPESSSSDEEDEFDGLDLTGLVGEDAAEAAEDVDKPAPASEDGSDDLDFDLNFSEDSSLDSTEPHSEFALDLDLDNSNEDETNNLDGIPNLGDEIGDMLGEDEGLEITGLNKEESDDSDELDFSLDTALGDDSSSVDDSSLIDPSSDTPSEEVATKLDLAQAYVDMGDDEGASEILKEVIEEGSSTQQSEAQKLLDQMS